MQRAKAGCCRAIRAASARRAGEVDQLVKSLAWDIIMNGVPGFCPGILLPGGKLNNKLPLGALLRIPFHDAGSHNK